MKVAGFTFVRNAVRLDYPVREAILSILPVCDEFVVALGNCDDGTESLIRSINSDKIRIFYTTWDDSKREGGSVLAEETNKAFKAISADTDWCFYIQADEVVHEKYLASITDAMQTYLADKTVDGLLFKYLHFYGSYDYVGESSQWYRREIRIVRRDERIFSYRDAQGFRKFPNQKLNVKLLDAYIYHYGWVKSPETMQAKQRSFLKFYLPDHWIDRHLSADEYDFSNIDALQIFKGTHPAVIADRIKRMNWKFSHDVSRKNLTLKETVRRFVEKYTGWRPGEYRNYKIV